MGLLLHARDAVLGREAALKLIPAHLVDAGARPRFLSEERLLAQLSHAAIVRLFDGG